MTRPDPTAATAIRRRKPSLPVRWLLKHRPELLLWRGLDYGCGHGADAKFLDIEGWDPYHRPEPQPDGPYNFVLCTYVLNVLSEAEAHDVLCKILNLLAPKGVGLVTVRRDMPHDYVTESGLVQRLVELDLPVIYENSKFCIYELTREDPK